MKKLLPALVVAIVTLASPLRAGGAAVTPDEVLAMMDQVPVSEQASYGKDPKGYGWSHQGHAKLVAKAIAAHAPSRESAAEMVVYGIFESGLIATAHGDSDRVTGKAHSWGVWQLSDKRMDPEKAKDPMMAAPVWLAITRESRQDCGELPPDEQLAELASGSCARGRKLAAHRQVVVNRVLGF